MGLATMLEGSAIPHTSCCSRSSAETRLPLAENLPGAWHGQLRLKLILISNVVPNFNDTTLVSRFMKVNFGQSFYGKEDVDLRNKLEAEISGIAVRCMTAYRRLIGRGKFIQPQSGVELERKVLAESDPWMTFVNDTFVIDVAEWLAALLRS